VLAYNQISIGGKIPEHYYASTEHGLDDQMDELETVTVYHGKTHTVPVDVKKAGSVLRCICWKNALRSLVMLLPNKIV
jgi:hypothetical protein